MSIPTFGQAPHRLSGWHQDFASGALDWAGEWDTDNGADTHQSYYRVDRLRPGYLVRDHCSYTSRSSRDYFTGEMRQIVRPYWQNGFWDPANGTWVRRLLWSREQGWYGAEQRHDWRFSVELEEGALQAALIMDVSEMDSCLAGELGYIHRHILPDGTIADLALGGNEYEYGLVLSALALGALHFNVNDRSVADATYADMRRFFLNVNKNLVPFSRPDAGECLMMRGYANASQAFDLYRDSFLGDAARVRLWSLAAHVIAHQGPDGSFDLRNDLYPVQDQLKADIGLMMAHRVSGCAALAAAVTENVQWIVARRWDSSERRMGGLRWSGVDSTSFYECHQMWFSIATKYLDECSGGAWAPFRAEALGFVLDDNFAGIDMFVHNEDTYGAFFAYRAISRDGTIQKEGCQQWKGAYEIGASLWALALNYDESTEGHSWLMTQAPEDSCDCWKKALFSAQDFGPGCMAFRWDAKFLDARRPGAYTGLFNDRRGGWRMVLDTTHGFAYRDSRDSTRVLVDRSMLASGKVYSVTIDRKSVREARLILEEGGRVLCDATVRNLKPCSSCYFGIFQDNGGALSAENVCVDNVSQTQGESVPEETRLCRCFPNPFNGGTSIEYDVKGRSTVRLLVFDGRGRRVADLGRTMEDAGRHEVYWDGRDGSGCRAASGIYFCVLETPKFSQSAKLVLLR